MTPKEKVHIFFTFFFKHSSFIVQPLFRQHICSFSHPPRSRTVWHGSLGTGIEGGQRSPCAPTIRLRQEWKHTNTTIHTYYLMIMHIYYILCVYIYILYLIFLDMHTHTYIYICIIRIFRYYAASTNYFSERLVSI